MYAISDVMLNTTHIFYHFQILQPPKVAPNQARLIIVPETALELGKELGSGAFGTVYKVMYLT